MRLLVFCGTRKALERFAADPEWKAVRPNLRDAMPEIVKWFHATPNAKMAMQGRAMLHGWRAPADTQILFDVSWSYGPDSAEWLQAASRVSRK